MAGKVTAGRFAGYKVLSDDGRQILYVKGNDEVMDLTPENVKRYQFTERPSLLVDKLCYCIEWQDGSKSIIAIPSTQKSFLISGCEVGAVGNTSTPHWLSTLAGILIFIACIAIAALVIVLIDPFPKKDASTKSASGSTNASASSKTTLAEWAEWDGDGSNLPKAKVLVHVTEATGYTSYGYGHIRGIAANATKSKFNYVQIVFAIYNQYRNKIGSCMANVAGLSSGETWEFEAYCSTWTEGLLYKIDSVTHY